MKSFEHQVRAMAETTVLIGAHGAGLGLSLYMSPNSAVVEMAPYGNDGRYSTVQYSIYSIPSLFYMVQSVHVRSLRELYHIIVCALL